MAVLLLPQIREKKFRRQEIDLDNSLMKSFAVDTALAESRFNIW